MEFTKYPDTDSLRHVLKQIGHNCEGCASYPVLPFRGSVKAHGTHADIISQRGEVWLQSRNRVVTCDADNSGFASFMAGVDIHALIGLVGASADSQVMISGEFCGKGIMTGVAVSKVPKFLMVFGVAIDSKWQDPEQYSHVKLPEQRIFNARDFGDYDTDIDFNRPGAEGERLLQLALTVEQECPIGKALGVTGPGEGVVFVPNPMVSPWKDGNSLAHHINRYRLKFKGDEHRNVDSKKLSQLEKQRAEKAWKIETQEFVSAVVSEHRLMQGVEYLKEMQKPLDVTSLGVFLKWLVDDIVKEEEDLMARYKVRVPALSKAVGAKAVAWYKQKCGAS